MMTVVRPRLLRLALVLAMFSGIAVPSGGQSTTATDGTTPAGLNTVGPAGFEQLNHYNGRLRLALPLLTVAGRGEATFNLTLQIDRIWRIQRDLVSSGLTGAPDMEQYTPLDAQWEDVDPGFSPGAVQGRAAGTEVIECGTVLRYATTLTRLTFVRSDGSETELRDTRTGGRPNQKPNPCTTGFNRGREFVSSDGSAMTFLSDSDIIDNDDVGPSGVFSPTGWLSFADGMRYRIVLGQVRVVKDRNGNQILINYDIAAGTMEVTDANHRRITVTRGSDGAGQFQQIAYNGVDGQPRIIRIRNGTLRPLLRHTRPSDPADVWTYEQLLPNLDNNRIATHLYNPPLVTSSVELPDGRKYEFRYNVYGELARVVMPTGGAVEYDWLGGINEHGVVGARDRNLAVYRRVVERRTYLHDGTLESRTTYSRPAAASVPVEVVEHDAAARELSRTRYHYFDWPLPSFAVPADGYNHWKSSLQKRVEHLNAAGQVMRAVDFDWQQTGPSWWPCCTSPNWAGEPWNNPRLASATTTLMDVVPNRVSKRVFLYDAFHNVTDEKTYDFGDNMPGPLLRHLVRGYVTDPAYTAGTSLTSPHLRRLLSREQLFSVNVNGAETLTSQTEYFYDEAAYPLLTAHDDEITAVTPVGWSDPQHTRRGNSTTLRQWVGGSVLYVDSHVQFDVVGNSRRLTNANSQVSRMTYGDRYRDNIARNTFACPTGTFSPVADATNVSGSSTPLQTTSTFDYWTGHVRTIVNENDLTQTYTYADPLDRLTRIDRFSGGATLYNYQIRPPGTPFGTYTVETLEQLDAGRWTSALQLFDGFGRPVRTFQHVLGTRGTTTARHLTVDVLYDALGRVRRMSLPYHSTGVDSATMNPAGRWKDTTYDYLGRITHVTTRPDNATTTTDYSGSSRTITDAAQKVQKETYDALNHLVTLTEDAKPGGLNLVTSYFYDAAGKVRRVTQDTQVRFFMYDQMSRLVRVRYPEMAVNGAIVATDPVTNNGSWSMLYEYDFNGNTTGRVDAAGRRTDTTFDGLDRPKLTRYSDATPDVHRTYDKALRGRGLPFSAETKTRGIKPLPLDRREINAYDGGGRPTQEAQYFRWNGTWTAPFSVTSGYDLAGNILSRTYPSGNRVTYAYDIGGRLVDTKGNLGGGAERAYAVETVFDDLGGRTQEKFGTAVPVYNKRFYNTRGQLEAIRVGTTANDTGWNRGAILYTYSVNAGWTESLADNNGTLRKQMIWIPMDESSAQWALFNQYFTYDGANRLDTMREEGVNVWIQDYEYDRWGNRTIHPTNTSSTVPSPQFEVDPATNRLHAPGDLARAPDSRVMQYDLAGNLTYDGYTSGGRHVYDAENRMIESTDVFGGTARHAYDGDGNRVRRGALGIERWQVYSGAVLLAEYVAGDAATVPQVEYAYRNAELLVTATRTSGSGGYSPSQPFVTINTKGAMRADSPGFCGMRITVGAQPITVTHLGRLCVGESVRMHEMRLIRASDNVTLSGTNIQFTGCSQGQIFRYVPLITPITLSPNTDYLIVSNEVGSDPFHDWWGTTLSSTPVATIKHGVYTTNGGQTWGVAGGIGNSYVPVDFQYMTSTAGVDLQWVISDHLGTPRMVMDASGSLAGVKRHDYFAYGQEIPGDFNGRNPSRGYGRDDIRQQFAGKERDDDTKLDYSIARYYNFAAGRFTGVDPLPTSARTSFGQSWNRYSYAMDSPINLIDPDGKDWAYFSWILDGVHYTEIRYFPGAPPKDWKPIKFNSEGVAEFQIGGRRIQLHSGDPMAYDVGPARSRGRGGPNAPARIREETAPGAAACDVCILVSRWAGGMPKFIGAFFAASAAGAAAILVATSGAVTGGVTAMWIEFAPIVQHGVTVIGGLARTAAYGGRAVNTLRVPWYSYSSYVQKVWQAEVIRRGGTVIVDNLEKAGKITWQELGAFAEAGLKIIYR